MQYTPSIYHARLCVMSRHSFDPEIAKQVGLNAAVIYQNILWWAEKNAANGKHYHDGLWWTYNSVSAFAELFPYLTSKQIRTALDKLVQEGLLVTERFNKSAYDQTKWYAPICLKDKADLPKQANEADQKGKPIPVSKPDAKPVSKRIYRHAWENGFPDWLPMDAWEGWIEMRNQRKKPLTGRAVTRALDRLRGFLEKGQDIAEVLDRSTMNGWTDLYEIKEQKNGWSKQKPKDGVSAALDDLLGIAEPSREADRRSTPQLAGNSPRAIEGPRNV